MSEVPVKPSMKILLVSLLGCLVVALPSSSAQKIKWCVKTQNELRKCEHLATKATEIECHLQPSMIDCIKSIHTGNTDVVTADGEHVYIGGFKKYNLQPLIAEKYKKECCYAVAVVKSDSTFNINELQGKTSCHGCYYSPSGWNIPIGTLVAKNKLPWEGPDEEALERAVSWFFSSSCIPGAPKARSPKLCKGCQGDCSCSHKEKYYGDEGALQCLKNDHGQVAFLCHNAIPASEKQAYQLLCLDGSRKSVDEYKSCYLAREPARAIIGRKDSDRQQIYNVLKQIPASDLFSSNVFGGKDLIFSDSAFGLMELPKITDSFLYLKEDYYEAMHALKDGKYPAAFVDNTITWCVVGHAEQMKCDKISSEFHRIQCGRFHEADSVDYCMEKIMRREVDAMTVCSGQAFMAHKCGLVSVMAEESNEQRCITSGEASSYYEVAVVRKGSGVVWNNLRNKKSCHTGLNRNAGWNVPDSVICGQTPGCTLYNFFSEGCAPGADPTSNLCKLCKGSGKPVGDNNKCKASSDEMYGFDGAFRCLAEKAGDVAFIKHTVVGDYTDGKGPDWAKNLKSDDFELICPELPEHTEKYTEFLKCNLAKVPAHVVITREDARSKVVSALKDAQVSVPDLFKSEIGRNLLFTDTTKCLQEITTSTEDFLTKKYMDMVEKTYKTQGEPDLVKACTLDNCRVNS